MNKEIYLNSAKVHIQEVQEHVESDKANVEKSIVKLEKELERNKGDIYVIQETLSTFKERVDELGVLIGSPYFVKCQIKFDDDPRIRIFYFAKFNFTKDSIFSWVVPAAVIRFEKPGLFSYKLPGGRIRSGELIQKDQYMIVDGKIMFMSTESKKEGRKLIYQEHLSQRKSSFILPEIIEQMEKAQDTVIRAPYKGSFLISGPAGSGKTTLALHRVAYLTQSPDTSVLFPSDNMIVFVQDRSTKDYFSHLLPDLGIHNVSITTFEDWASSVLEIESINYIFRFGKLEEEKDVYEYEKNKGLKGFAFQESTSENIYDLLFEYYKQYFSKLSNELFEKQKGEGLLDRFDLSILLKIKFIQDTGFKKLRIFYEPLKNGSLKKKVEIVPLKYSLIVLDEVQNYLSEQLSLIKSCMNEKTDAMLYVGDLAQQTRLCTIKDWSLIGEKFDDRRIVELNKVYRSTYQIVDFVRSLGFDIEVPKGLKKGNPVEEIIVETIDEEIDYIQSQVNQLQQDSIIGIISKDASYLDMFIEEFKNKKNIHIMTIHQAQGLEFDSLFFVGVNQEFFEIQDSSISKELLEQRKVVNKDLIYVCLTRAMNQLHILGKNYIRDLLLN